MLHYNIGVPAHPGAALSVGVLVDMNWFRSNIRHGSRLALLALAVQIVLSFGHVHAATAAVVQSATRSDPVEVRGLDAGMPVSTVAAQPAQPQSDHDADGRQNDVCAVCAVMAMAHAALFSTPPVLLLPQAAELGPPAIDAAFVHVDGAHASFQPRAPPVS